MTALVVDSEGRLTYMGEDGCRRQIVGDPELLARLRQLQDQVSDDFDDGLQGKGFEIRNPNAESTCGCGKSFS